MQHWKPEHLELAYELLRATKPFSGWRLPEADEVEFHVVRMKDQADCHWNGNWHVIRIADNRHASLAPLLVTMAHEMLHMYLDRTYPKDRAAHGWRFKRYADRICRHHTFDRGQF